MTELIINSWLLCSLLHAITLLVCFFLCLSPLQLNQLITWIFHALQIQNYKKLIKFFPFYFRYSPTRQSIRTHNHCLTMWITNIITTLGPEVYSEFVIQRKDHQQQPVSKNGMPSINVIVSLSATTLRLEFSIKTYSNRMRKPQKGQSSVFINTFSFVFWKKSPEKATNEWKFEIIIRKNENLTRFFNLKEKTIIRRMFCVCETFSFIHHHRDETKKCGILFKSACAQIESNLSWNIKKKDVRYNSSKQ